LMLADAANIARVKATLDEGKFVSPDCRVVVDRLYRWQVDEGPVDMVRLMSFLGENSGATSLVAMVCAEEAIYPAETAKRVLADCVEVLKRRRFEELGKLLAAADMEGQKAQQGVIVEYQTLLKELKGSRTG